MCFVYIASGGFIFGNFSYSKKKNQSLDLLQNTGKIKILVSLTTAEILPFQPQGHIQTSDCWLLHAARHPVSNSCGVSGDIGAAQAGFLLNKMLTAMLQHM